MTAGQPVPHIAIEGPSLASTGTDLRRGSTHQAMTGLPIEFCSQGAI